MTPSRSYRVVYGESLGRTVQHILDGDPVPTTSGRREVLDSYAEGSEYADMVPQVVETAIEMAGERQVRTRRGLRSVGDWLRRHYGLRDIIMPEKYLVGRRHDVVVTYSSCLALVYFADSEERLPRSTILADTHRRHLHLSLLQHPGIGLLATIDDDGVHVESREGHATIRDGELEVMTGTNPLEVYEAARYTVRAVEDLIRQSNNGDIVLFGAYDGHDIVSFDDQVGAHGSAGGQQVYPFLITPDSLDVADERIEDARDIHRVILSHYADMHPATEYEDAAVSS